MGTGIFIKTPSLDDCQPRLKSASSARERKRLYPASFQSDISCKVVDETWPFLFAQEYLEQIKKDVV